MTQAIDDPFAVKYSRPEGAKVPSGRHIHGRLIVAIPVGREPIMTVPNEKGEPGSVQDRLTADVIVCDGGTIWYGGDLQIPGSDTSQMQSPCVIPAMWLFGKALIEWIDDASQRGAALGRIVKKATKAGNKTYWTMEAPTPQDRQIALPLFRQYQAGTLFSEANLPAAGTPAGTQAMPQFGTPAAPANPFTFPTPPAPVAPADWTLAQQIPAQFLAAGATAEQWTGATQEQRAGFLGQMGITAPNMQPTGL